MAFIGSFMIISAKKSARSKPQPPYPTGGADSNLSFLCYMKHLSSFKSKCKRPWWSGFNSLSIWSYWSFLKNGSSRMATGMLLWDSNKSMKLSDMNSRVSRAWKFSMNENVRSLYRLGDWGFLALASSPRSSKTMANALNRIADEGSRHAFMMAFSVTSRTLWSISSIRLSMISGSSYQRAIMILKFRSLSFSKSSAIIKTSLMRMYWSYSIPQCGSTSGKTSFKSSGKFPYSETRSP